METSVSRQQYIYMPTQFIYLLGFYVQKLLCYILFFSVILKANFFALHWKHLVLDQKINMILNIYTDVEWFAG